MRVYAALSALLLVVVLAGCGNDDAQPEADPTDTSSHSPSEPTADDSESASSSETPTSPSSGQGESDLPDPGTPESPTAVDPVAHLLTWEDLGDSTETVTMGQKYVAMKSDDGRRAQVGVAHSGDIRDLKAPKGYRFADVLLDGQWAVVVAQHDQESKPAIAQVFDLSTGDSRTLDAKSNPATVSGGAWAIGQGRVFHATTGRGGAYCLAEVDLASGEGQTTYCAEKNTGFNNVRITPDGLSLMSFDSGKISCRTVVTVGEAALEPMAGAPDCRAWEGFSLPDGNAVFTVVEKEQRIERSQVVARVGDGYYNLGHTTSGSLIWCDGAAWFPQDAERDGEPSRLMRWDGTRLTTAFEAGQGGPSALSAPRCGGDAISLSLLAETGDQQVSAPTH